MKTSFKTIAFTVLFAIAFAFNSFADEKEGKKTAFGTGMFASKSGKIHLAVDKYNNSITTILVSDASGRVVHRETIGRHVSKFRTAFNVNQLPAGTYTIDISSNGQKESKKFEVQEETRQRAIAIL